MQTSVIEANPDADLSITVVWSDWWPFDSGDTAHRSASIIDPDDKRVRHFYDPDRVLGKAVARSLGWKDAEKDENAAWDIYLFYPAGVRWEDAMPKPEIDVHQLANRRNEASFKTGDGLVKALREATAKAVAGDGA